MVISEKRTNSAEMRIGGTKGTGYEGGEENEMRVDKIR